MNTKDFSGSASKREAMLKSLEKHLPVEPTPPPTLESEIQDDYEFSRNSYRELVSKSNQAIESMLDLALQAEHPRAFEVLSTMLKNTSEITDKLMDLQKKKKDIKNDGGKSVVAPQLTQHNTFIGTTKDLQKELVKQLAEKNVSDTAPTP